MTWKSEAVQVQQKSDDGNGNNKKMWRILVKFPKTDTEDEAFMVLEIFTLVRVKLTRKAKTNSLEAELLRPISQRVF